jgi:hypothetical protein
MRSGMNDTRFGCRAASGNPAGRDGHDRERAFELALIAYLPHCNLPDASLAGRSNDTEPENGVTSGFSQVLG